MRRYLITSALWLVCGICSLGVFAGTELPEGKGKDVVEAMCQNCHSLDSITQKRRSREDWQGVVDQMISNGAPLTPREAEIVVTYLSEHFGPVPSSDTSKASAKSAFSVSRQRQKSWNRD
jgi:hypothetical protein